MQFLQSVLFGVLAVEVAAVPFPSNHVLHERRIDAPKAWIKRDRVAESALLPVRIGMTQSNLDKGHDLLMDVYDLAFELFVKTCPNSFILVPSTILPNMANTTHLRRLLKFLRPCNQV